jgi:hypothetical protein
VLSPKKKAKLDPYVQDEGDNLNQEELELIKFLIPLMSSGNANRIPELLIPFSDNLPPTERDLSIAKVVTILIDEMGTVDESFWGTSVQAWTPLVKSKNPIYRYLALKGIKRSVSEPLQKYSKQYPNTDPRLDYLSASEKFDVYREYFDETDNHIQLELYRALRSVPLQTNLNYLKSQLSIHKSSKALSLIDALKDAIENVERLLGMPPEDLPLGWGGRDANTEIPSTTPAVVEATEEPLTVKTKVQEFAEIKPVEAAKETPEESSHWWLWLLGALIVVGGLGLVLRRKN